MAHAALVQEGDRLWKVTNGTFASNTYIRATATPGSGFLVDPGMDAELIDAALADLAIEPRFVLCTHGHFDHVGSAAFFQRKYGAKVLLHADDVRTMKASNFLLTAFKLPQRIDLPVLDGRVGDGFTVLIDGESVRFDATAGHTPGSCVISYGPAVFSGDTLFSRGVGLSRLPGEDPERLRASLRALWDRFPAASMVYPGHGDSASLGWIKQHNHKLLQFMGLPDPRADAAPA